MFKMGRYTHETLVDDILAWMHIAFITICPTVINALKNLKNNQECLKKLKSKIFENFNVIDVEEEKKEEVAEKIENKSVFDVS